MLDLKRQYLPLHDELMQAVGNVLDTQQFILGEPVAAFEKSSAAQLGVAHAIGCSSGTDALWLALAAAGIGHGQAVVTTPFSFFASTSAILRAGATPLLADIEPTTFNLDPKAVQILLDGERGAEVKAILPVHLFGQCADWPAFTYLQKKYGLKLVEDAAQAWGADYSGVKAGALGDAAAFSFYPTKNLAAFGDAGMVTTNNAAVAEQLRMLRAHGMKKRYFHEEVGWNSRLDTIQAAVLEVKLTRVEAGNARRRELAALYDRLFRAAGLTGTTTAEGLVLPFSDPRAKHVFHQYVIRAPRRDELRAFLTENGIGTEVYYPLPLHLQPALRSLGYWQGDFPVAERAAAEVLALPIYPELSDEEVENVVEGVRRFYQG